MSAEEFNADNVLHDTYSLDDQSFKEEEESQSVQSSSNGIDDLQYINFIQAIKDNNVEILKSMTLSFPSFVNKIGPEGLTSIQYATLFSKEESFKFLIEKEAAKDCLVEGLPLLHLSLSFSLFKDHRQKAVDLFKTVYEGYPLLREQRDRLGRNIIHLIAHYDIDEAVSIVNMHNEDLCCKDYNGDSPISYIYLYQSYNVFKRLCFCVGVKPLYSLIRAQSMKFVEGCFVFHFFEPIAFLIDNCKEIKEELMEDLTNIRAFYSNSEEIMQNCQLALDHLNHQTNDTNSDANQLLPNYTQSIFSTEKKLPFHLSNNKTSLLYNNNCILHIKLPEDPVRRIKLRHDHVENSDRLSVLIQPSYGILLSDKTVNNSSIVFNECKRKAALVDILRCHDINYINKIKKQCESSQETPVLIDTDTYINNHTFESIFDATGSVLEAVDSVMTGKTTNAFVLLRPPGHHAGYFGGVTPDNESSPISNGFCIVNNICIGAAYCKYQYRHIIKKIAIVDFDVHHGNGTEEIISLLNQKEMHSSFKSFLGNVDISKTFMNPWLDYDDPSNVLFISLHAYNEVNPKSFYPYSGGAEKNTKKINPIYPGGIMNIPLTQNMKYSYEYRHVFRQKVIPRLYKFKPDIIFISAGFDGHEKETINAGLMCLNEFDYSFLTEQLQSVANRLCEGRLVSVLEGGYNVQSGIVSSFAQSVMCHLKALNTSINKAVLQEGPLTQLKRQREYERDYENYKLSRETDLKPRRSDRICHNAEEKDKKREQKTEMNIQDLNNVFSYEKEVQIKKELILSKEEDEKMENNANDNNTKNYYPEDVDEFEIDEEDANLP